jgi:Integrase core domain.
MNSVSQDIKYRQSLLNYAAKNGVMKASVKYNRSRSYIYFWRARYDGTPQSLACQSRRPHSHPSAHTDAELKLIRDMRRRNPKMGLCEFWARLKSRGYTRHIVSLYRVMRRLALFKQGTVIKKKYVPKPYESMQYPGQRVQIDVKVVPPSCIADPDLKLFQYTAIDEFSRLRFLAGYDEQSTYSSADFLKKAVAFFKRNGFYIECVQTDNGSEFTNRFSTSKKGKVTLFTHTAYQLGIRHKLIRPYTPRHNGKVERSHRQDQHLFYAFHRFSSLTDFNAQLKIRSRRSNSTPMKPLNWSSPLQSISSFFVQYH